MTKKERLDALFDRKNSIWRDMVDLAEECAENIVNGEPTDESEEQFRLVARRHQVYKDMISVIGTEMLELFK